MKKDSGLRVVLGTFFSQVKNILLTLQLSPKFLFENGLEKYLDNIASIERILLSSHFTHSQKSWVSDGVRVSEKRKNICVTKNVL